MAHASNVNFISYIHLGCSCNNTNSYSTRQKSKRMRRKRRREERNEKHYAQTEAFDQRPVEPLLVSFPLLIVKESNHSHPSRTTTFTFKKGQKKRRED